MNFKPRDYQQYGFDAARTLFRTKLSELRNLDLRGLSFDPEAFPEDDRLVKRIMVTGVPGAGKGDLLCWMASEAWKNGGTVLLWVHRVELCEDLGDRMHRAFGIPKSEIGYIMSGRPENHQARIQIASVATKIRRITDWLLPTLILTDECHRILSPSQRSLINRYPEVRLIGVTATPFLSGSSKKEGFEKVFDCLVQFTTYMELVGKRFLLPTVVYEPDGRANTEGVKIRIGDYVQDELERAFMEEKLYAALFSEWKRITGGKMATMIFNVSRKHNNAVNDFFVKHGVNAVAIDDKTPTKEREALIRKFKEGPFTDNPIMVINSIMLFTEGIDAPMCKVAVLNYKTLSAVKYFQSAMRAGRPVWNSDYSDWLRLENGKYYKEKVIIIDLGGNTHTHGMIDTYDALGFDISGKRREGVAPTKTCPEVECRKVVYASARKCPYCGYEFPIEKKKDKKATLDEVGLKERTNDSRNIRLMVSRMSVKQLNAAQPHMLRIIAHCKGHGNVWIAHMMKHKKMIPWFNSDQESWKRLWAMLEETEKKHGTYDMYQSLKGGRVLG